MNLRIFICAKYWKKTKLKIIVSQIVTVWQLNIKLNHWSFYAILTYCISSITKNLKRTLGYFNTSESTSFDPVSTILFSIIHFSSSFIKLFINHTCMKHTVCETSSMLHTLLRVNQTQTILFVKSMWKKDGSNIQWLWNRKLNF